MYRSSKLREVETLLKNDHSSFGIASSIILTWLMKTDGNISREETKILNDFLGQFSLVAYKDLFESIIDDFDTQCIELAAEILRRVVDKKGQRLVLELFLGMILADGYITYTEVYVIEFIADLFKISPGKLDKIFIEATGRSKIEVGDPSSASWWAERSNGKNKSGQKEDKKRNRNTNKSSSQSYNSKRQKALAILGLEMGATQKEIKKSFRMLTKIHHPDRFDQLGDEAKRSANSTYIRIKDAYEYLMSS